MPGGLLRVALLAAALVAVAVVSVVSSWGTWTIIAVMAISFLAVSAIEIAASQRETVAVDEGPEPGAGPEPTGEELPQHVRVLREDGEPEPALQQTGTTQSEPTPAPEPELEAARPAPEPEPEVVRPPLAAVPTPPAVPPPPEPVPEPAPPPEPEPTVVTLAAHDARPREWNLWDLERATRDASGRDPLRDEERNYLLMYLREFASPEGTLSSDFDALVRDSFGDLLFATR